jgi:putative transposase/transposase-like zinc-binding protein
MSLAAPAGAAGTRRGVELSDVFRAHGEAYRQTHRLSGQQTRVMAAIEACRTAQLGGHREYCEACDFERFAYNSCRNRHCPKCQSLAREEWLQQRRAELLPVPYFHLVLTLPHELNGLVLANPRPLLDLLFQAGAQTLLQFGRNRFGGQVGFTMILHTWDQTLGPHFHLHCLITGGALAADHSHWIAGNPTFLFPVHALSKVFRGKFLDGLRRLRRGDQLRSDHENLDRMLDELGRKPWVVYAKKPFAGPGQVLEYLGRYTHRVAISNDRILDLSGGMVTFAYRDRAHDDVRRTMILPAEEFIRRFLIHVLPRGFMRIRHFGFLANRSKAHALARCRELLGVEAPEPSEPQSTAERILRLTGTDISRCPRCGHRPLMREELAPQRPGRAPQPPVFDSS